MSSTNKTINRQSWADIAKAFSIILLVCWHADGFHWLFSYLRMPLFFLVSGYFAYNSIHNTDDRKFYCDKVGNMLYLYILWSLIITVTLYIFADRGRVAYHLENWTVILWQPLPTMWFIYALAVSFVICRLLRNLPFIPVLAVSLLLYFVVNIDVSGNVGFIDKVVKLFPFFWIGLKAPEWVNRGVEFGKVSFPITFAAYFALAWYGDLIPDALFGLYYFVTALIGILSVAGMSLLLSRFSFTNFLSAIGGATVYIYLMHRPALYYLEGVFKKLGIEFTGVTALKVLIIVLTCYFAGKWMTDKKGLRHLLSAPWVTRKVRVMK